MSPGADSIDTTPAADSIVHVHFSFKTPVAGNIAVTFNIQGCAIPPVQESGLSGACYK